MATSFQDDLLILDDDVSLSVSFQFLERRRWTLTYKSTNSVRRLMITRPGDAGPA